MQNSKKPNALVAERTATTDAILCGILRQDLLDFQRREAQTSFENSLYGGQNSNCTMLSEKRTMMDDDPLTNLYQLVVEDQQVIH